MNNHPNIQIAGLTASTSADASSCAFKASDPHSASTSALTVSAAGRASRDPGRSGNINDLPDADSELSSNTMNGTFATTTSGNCNIAASRSTPRPHHTELLAIHQRDYLIRTLKKLIPILREMNLLDQTLPASVVTSIIRSRKSRFPGQSFRAVELAKEIDSFVMLTVDGVDVSASVGWNVFADKTTSSISFHRSLNLTDTNCNEFAVANYIKSNAEQSPPDEATIRKKERSLRKLEEAQREALMKMSQDPNRPRYEECEDDREFMDQLRQLMGKNRTNNLNPVQPEPSGTNITTNTGRINCRDESSI